VVAVLIGSQAIVQTKACPLDYPLACPMDSPLDTLLDLDGCLDSPKTQV